MVLQGKIVATGYRFTTPPADPSKLDADDLLQGGPAVSIEGNVAKGIILAVPPKDSSTTDNDEDDDGIEDCEGRLGRHHFLSARRRPCGSARPAPSRSARPKGTGTGFGLIVDGGILGDGVYAGVDGNALQIGGLGRHGLDRQRHRRDRHDQAKSFDRSMRPPSASAPGTTTPELRNAGKILASSGNTAASVATAVDIEAGANLPILRNSGEIKATTGEAGHGGRHRRQVGHAGPDREQRDHLRLRRGRHVEPQRRDRP